MHTEWNRAASGAESTACELCQIHVCMCTHMRVSHSFVRAFVCGFLCSRRPMGQRPFILQSECAHACRPNRTYVISPQCARVSHAMYTNNTLIRRRTCANVCEEGSERRARAFDARFAIDKRPKWPSASDVGESNAPPRE